MQRYAITDRTAYPGDAPAQKDALEAQAVRLAQQGVDYLQVREKDLATHERVALAVRLRDAISRCSGRTKVMFNGEPSLAVLAGADGVHLPGALLGRAWRTADFVVQGRRMLVSAACHTLADVERAREFADVLLFAPVFGKRVDGTHVNDGVGLKALRAVCQVAGSVPVLPLGGVTLENVGECLAVGAAGMAGIRAFL